MIKRILIIMGMLVFFGSELTAKVIHQNYQAKFGIFGTVGNIKNKLTKNAKTYQIETRVKLAGVAKMLLGGQQEYYVSKGHMENELMVSDFYEMTSIKGKKKKVKTYTIDHKKKYVTKRYRKWENAKLLKDKTTKLKFYAKDDLLTLYFNLGKAVKEEGKKYNFNVVGLEKQNGKVQITVPSKSQLKPYIKDLGSSATLYAKALIYQKSFNKKKGNILLAVGEDGFIEKSVIKDIMMYGDAVLTRVK